MREGQGPTEKEEAGSRSISSAPTSSIRSFRKTFADLDFSILPPLSAFIKVKVLSGLHANFTNNGTQRESRSLFLHPPRPRLLVTSIRRHLSFTVSWPLFCQDWLTIFSLLSSVRSHQLP